MGLSLHIAYTFLDTEILEVDGLSTAPPPFKPGDPLIRASASSDRHPRRLRHQTG